MRYEMDNWAEEEEEEGPPKKVASVHLHLLRRLLNPKPRPPPAGHRLATKMPKGGLTQALSIEQPVRTI
jgi:hypothetical protein